MIEVAVRHNFETGHRLPHLPGKCQSLHGHSWWATVVVGADRLGDDGIVVDFGSLKAGLRKWIDTNLDHGLMLGWDDPLTPIMREHGKVFVFDAIRGNWPTVENVAGVIAHQAEQLVIDYPGVKVLRVSVQETSVNEATWTS